MAKISLNPKDKKRFCMHRVVGGYDCGKCKPCCAREGQGDHLKVCKRKVKDGHRGFGLPRGGKRAERCCCGEDSYVQFF
ncbi:hypothetical protein KSF_098870 [Reticulibacter mediterranei]|uniref:Uncharacterized protein n=1 Tax=Reticulibacter mediterranei TaxID=2778369 RepID=A0A8J3IQ09_9CHLR|nr:hypothetical protein KSF_098870 [Reticulibacter mediterranei]